MVWGHVDGAIQRFVALWWTGLRSGLLKLVVHLVHHGLEVCYAFHNRVDVCISSVTGKEDRETCEILIGLLVLEDHREHLFLSSELQFRVEGFEG